jgi:hypothetical protein
MDTEAQRFANYLKRVLPGIAFGSELTGQGGNVGFTGFASTRGSELTGSACRCECFAAGVGLVKASAAFLPVARAAEWAAECARPAA